MGPWCADMGASGWIAMGGVWIAVIATAIWALGRLFPADGGGGSHRSSLDGQLARGEIDTETYRRLRRELDGATTTEQGATR